jgi:hypothetical protein
MLLITEINHTYVQIEGFKLHVVHNLRPFVNRIRYTPEVASKPDRLEKDLANAKILASLLEDEAAALRRTKITNLSATDPAIEGVEGENGQAEQKEDAFMTDGQAPGEEEEEEEPKERGSEAVEKRIEKTMAEIRDQGLVDVDDEKALQARKVCSFYLPHLIASTQIIDYRRWCRLTCTLTTCELRSTHVTTAPL